MDRNKRYKKRLAKLKSNNYLKREITTDKVCHYILYPIVFSTIGKTNDFYFHILKLCWNDKNLLKDFRCQEMFRGLHLQQGVEIADLVLSAETGWFTSSRRNDLAKIGKICGYFIRNFACSIGQALDEKFNPEAYPPILDEKFNACVYTLKENKAIIPVVVKLEISPQSNFDTERFICLSENLVSNLTDEDEEVEATCRAKLLKIKPELHSWSWRLLNVRSFEERVELLNDGIPLELPSSAENESIQSRRLQSQNRPASTREKYPSKKYPSNMYERK